MMSPRVIFQVRTGRCKASNDIAGLKKVQSGRLKGCWKLQVEETPGREIHPIAKSSEDADRFTEDVLKLHM